MPFQRRNRLKTVAFAALLVCFTFAYGQSCLPHTDDGCAVELHCFACRWTIASTAEVAPPPNLLPTLQAVGTVEPVEVGAAPDPAAPAVSSRGPPLA